MKAHLRDTVQQYEGSTEELKASNEELQAMNEELRSATEELETSREELQSINEELSTVNAGAEGQGRRAGARQQRPAQPDGGHRDRHRVPRPRAEHHAVHAVGGAAVQPDPDATSAGRSATSPPRSTIRRCSTDAQPRLDQLEPAEREVRSGDRWFLARVLPYRTTDDRIGGVVFTFLDITARKHARGCTARVGAAV